MMKLYEGSFNYHGQVFKLFRHANTINQAYFLMTLKLSRELKVTHSTVKYYFGGLRDNFKVKEIIDEKRTSN